ncbi:MAG: ISAzo13 family transposase, partial [Bacteroidetes bacterium]|nr:ISAzo13 family transposase [Bacteroidota bacterium]
MKDEKLISERNKILSPFLDEKSRKLLCAAESKVIGHGGIAIVSKAIGVSRTTVSTGLKELENPERIDNSR